MKSSCRSLLLPALFSFAGFLPSVARAGDADLALPSAVERAKITFDFLGMPLSGSTILIIGLAIAILGVLFGLYECMNLKKLPAHKSMLDVSSLIYSTCKTYLFQQAKLLAVLEVIIGCTMVYYFGWLQHRSLPTVALIIGWSLLGIAGSFAVAWFGMLINNIANSRMAFAALKGKALAVSEIPTRSGMSIGVLLVSIELFMMLAVLKFVEPELAGSCFIGFAIGESLGASVLRICGGIFTKIADIGSDLMKIVFGIKEDDARNPGVIADCAGDNAGDSVGPTADGFETYGVTGVALVTFILLAVFKPEHQWTLIIWIFAMRIVMVPLSVIAWKINSYITRGAFAKQARFNFEHPLTVLVWLTSILCIAATFIVSYFMLAKDYPTLWWRLSTIISCGTIAAAIIPELTRMFTSTSSAHCQEVVNASSEGGAGLTILSGLVAGNFSCFWKGLTIALLMAISLVVSTGSDAFSAYMTFPAVFAFGLVAFGMLGMGPVTIAVDSYGPVADNAQSVFELSTIEQISGIEDEVKRDFGFRPDFENGKALLEDNDGCGNTFKATAKPMLIGTAVVGATTMIFSLILMLKSHFIEQDPSWASLAPLNITEGRIILGLLMGGAVVYWFAGASQQAVTTGAYRAVDYIKKHMHLDGATKASTKDSNEVVKICTQYAQQGMFNIFIVIFSLALAFACLDPVFFVGYLVSLAVFGLFMAIYMANAGGCWDNAKKIVETELRCKGTPLHDATVIGDIVGDPFKDTSSVALNPIIKFTTLFGILAVEIAIQIASNSVRYSLAGVFFAIGVIFVWRSFYGMRISALSPAEHIRQNGKSQEAKEEKPVTV